MEVLVALALVLIRSQHGGAGEFGKDTDGSQDCSGGDFDKGTDGSQSGSADDFGKDTDETKDSTDTAGKITSPSETSGTHSEVDKDGDINANIPGNLKSTTKGIPQAMDNSSKDIPDGGKSPRSWTGCRYTSF